MKLITKQQRERMLANGARNAAQGGGIDFKPVIKLFTPDANATWLLTELDPDDDDRAFGLCDLGLGYPEAGYVSIAELSALRGKLGLPVERDAWFEAQYPLSAYVNAARCAGCIVTDDSQLQNADAVKGGVQ